MFRKAENLNLLVDMICRGLPQELERFERQFQWYIGKALGCITALDTNQGEFKG